MNFTILTIFPDMFQGFVQYGIVRRAIEAGQITVAPTDIRDFAAGRHRVTDDRPYGGGCGMVMKPEPLAAAIRFARGRQPNTHVVLLSPQGSLFSQENARRLARRESLTLICGRYEGIDDRICQSWVDEEISIGDYVLTGGELPAMVVIDAVVRLLPGVLGGDESAEKDSFADGLLEHGHYTRPYRFEEAEVPEVLLSGNHAAIDRWRYESSLLRTVIRRPDLLTGRALTPEESRVLRGWRRRLEQLLAEEATGDDAAG